MTPERIAELRAWAEDAAGDNDAATDWGAPLHEALDEIERLSLLVPEWEYGDAEAAGVAAGDEPLLIAGVEISGSTWVREAFRRDIADIQCDIDRGIEDAPRIYAYAVFPAAPPLQVLDG